MEQTYIRFEDNPIGAGHWVTCVACGCEAGTCPCSAKRRLDLYVGRDEDGYAVVAFEDGATPRRIRAEEVQYIMEYRDRIEARWQEQYAKEWK